MVATTTVQKCSKVDIQRTKCGSVIFNPESKDIFGSFCFLSLKLSKLPKIMDFHGSKELQPHLFNIMTSQDYTGLLTTVMNKDQQVDSNSTFW